jgi:Asp-tRNA(Asn)/Glu-tRNA(Gln) amidotransferase A subunit family amidase
MNDLTFSSAHQLAQMIRDSQISSLEVVEAHLAQISRHNPQLNAICTLDAENARTRAKEADLALARGENWGRLHGVPITAKDIFETANLRTTAGYIPLKNYIPPQDATIVARLKSAVPLDTPSGKSLSDLKIAWSDEWAEVPVAAEIKSVMMASAQKLRLAGANVTSWMPPNFNLSEIFGLYGRMAAYVNRYAQPADRYNLRHSVELLWRTATQGDRSGRSRIGLPIGIQIVGQRWREMELLSIAQEIDNVIGDFRHPPATQAVKTAACDAKSAYAD